MNNKDLIYIVIILLLLGIVGYFLTQYAANETVTSPTGYEMEPIESNNAEAAGESLMEGGRGNESLVGTSANGADILAYHFGTGENELLLIGGVHGGYSWNTSLLAYELIDYLSKNPSLIPETAMVTIIPVLNPDGLKNTVGSYGRFDSADAVLLGESKRISGRFNANDVDLNRNFDCDWKETSEWRNQEVSGGDEPFSEPETHALRDYVVNYPPTSVIVWFSSEGKVYPSACDGKPSPESKTLATTFAKAASYDYETSFDAYSITGDMVNWMAKMKLPAISVLLTDHTDTEFEKNLNGIKAVLENNNE